jgi:hypothetical protein
MTATPEGGKLVKVYRLPIKKRVRVLIDYDGTARPVFWLEVGPDGSVYFGPCRVPESAISGTRRVPGDGVVHCKFADVDELIKPERLHVSFHASGVINVGGFRSGRSELRKLKVPHQLCVFALKHPSKYPPARRARKTDFIVKYPLDEGWPIHGELFFSPVDTAIGLEDAVHQTQLIFEVRGLDAPVWLEFVMGHGGTTGTWPEKTIVAWRAIAGISVEDSPSVK